MNRPTTSPMISVVVPTFERAHLVGEAIASVLQQTYPHFELLVVDDGSTDGTTELISQFKDARLTLVSIAHQGRSQARNEGVARARGEWIVFLDSDDQAGPTWLEEMHSASHDAAVGVVCCGARVSTEHAAGGDHAARTMLPRRLGPIYSNRVGLFRAGTFLVRREVFEAVGGYDRRLAYAENSELAIRLARYCDERSRGFATVHRPLIRIRKRRESTGEAGLRERLEATELMLERHGDWYRTAAAPAYARHRAIAGTYAYRLGRRGRAIRHFAAAAAAHPGRPAHWGRLCLALVSPLARRVWTSQTHGRDARASVLGGH